MKTAGTRDDAVTRRPTDEVSGRGRWRGQAKATLRHDLPASLTVFMVAVPLSLGIALASGAPLTSGLIAAAIGESSPARWAGRRCRSAGLLRA